VLREEPFDENLTELDEYVIAFDKTSGEILLSRNNDRVAQPRILTFADSNQTFYPFLFPNGRITALAVFALIAGNIQTMETNLHPPATNTTDLSEDDSDTCTISFDAKST
jgi:hypothetical protein